MTTKSCEIDHSPVHLRGLLRHFADLRDGTHGDGAADAAAELPTLRAIASADLHNLVFQSDYRIVPAITHSSIGTVKGGSR